MNKTRTKKIVNIVLNVLLYLFLAVCIFAVLVTLFSKQDTDGAKDIFGYELRIVTSDSMAPCELTDVSGYDIGSIPVRSLIIVKTMPTDPAEAEEWYRGLEAGDVLTFRYVYTTQVTITHRIATDVEETEGGFIIKLEGDNKNSEDSQLYQTIDTSIPNNMNYVIGEVVAKSYVLGLIISLLMTPLGIVLAVILPCFVIIGLEVWKIAKTLLEEKKQAEKAEAEKKDKEIEDLRRRLAELEGNDPPDTESKEESEE